MKSLGHNSYTSHIVAHFEKKVYAWYNAVRSWGIFDNFCVKNNLTVCKVTFNCKLQKKIGKAGCTSCYPNNFVGAAPAPLLPAPMLTQLCSVQVCTSLLSEFGTRKLWKLVVQVCWLCVRAIRAAVSTVNSTVEGCNCYVYVFVYKTKWINHIIGCDIHVHFFPCKLII